MPPAKKATKKATFLDDAIPRSWRSCAQAGAAHSFVPAVISCYDISMPKPAADQLLRTLADFRYELRRFQQFSEMAASAVGLQAQQHQLLLQVAGAPQDTAVTIAYAAERLGLRHNSTVELVDRSVREGLLTRKTDPGDRRRVLLHLTERGTQILGRLSGEHARELNDLGPRLERALKHIRLHAHVAA